MEKNYSPPFTGNNNGMSGFGMTGSFFPKVLNGPFGFQTMPLPENQQKLVGLSPKFNSKYGQYPYYNENILLAKSRFSQLPSSSFNYKLNSGLIFKKD